MEVSNKLQSKAEVIRIITLEKDNIYKRIQEDKQYDGTISTNVFFGIVASVTHAGDKVAVSAFEFPDSLGIYSEGSFNDALRMKTFSESQDLFISECDQDEFDFYADRFFESMNMFVAKQVKEAQRLDDARMLFGAIVSKYRKGALDE